MAAIQELRKIFFQLMDQECKSESLTLSTNNEIESQAFMLKEHAQAIREVCKVGGYTVSFRITGESTLKWIRNGNPCKGHSIIDKSIRKSGEMWNYESQDKALNDIEGLVGFSLHDESNELHGVWVETDNKPVKCSLTKACSYTHTCYTGDYDMHDLLKCHDTKFTPLIPATKDEDVAIDCFNRCLLKASLCDMQLQANNEKTCDRYSKIQSFLDANKGEYIKNSEYALIRHGAQTSYWFYLHCDESGNELGELLSSNSARNLLWRNDVINISTPICFFNNQGEAYILKNIYQIYLYYKVNGILPHIPFIYFFRPLQEIAENNHELSKILKRNSEFITKWAEDYFK